LLGAGSMGALHARVISQHSGCELAGVVDPRADAGRKLAERFETTWRPTLDSLVGVDALVVATSTETHAGLARQALDDGIPILVEKPLTTSPVVTRELVAASAARDVPLMCGLLERYNPAVLTASRLISQPIGVKAIRHSPYAPRIMTGVAWDLLIHDIDLALRFVDSPVTTVQGVSARFSPVSKPGAEDVCEATIAFASGAVATASASRVAQRKVRTITVFELDKLFEIDLLLRTVTIHHHIAAEAMAPDGRGYRQQTIIEIPELVTSREPLASQLDQFLELIAGESDASAERDSILPAHDVVGAVVESVRLGDAQ